jgi:hypothetical protein
VQPIENANDPEMNIEPLMMGIMIPSYSAAEGESRVHGTGLQQSERQESPHGHDVCVEYHGRDDDGQNVGKEMLRQASISAHANYDCIK